jgi:ATP-binding cassette subfamily F protein uup
MEMLAPDSGSVRVGPTVKFSYIDQSRSDLDPTKNVVDEIAGGNPHIMVGGHSIKVESYLERFLFPSSLLRSRVGNLSGGERNRLLIAKLLAVGGNVLVLDEPTNDLDLMTLRVLEEALIAFPGSALIVSHDRWFLDRVATRVLHLSTDGSDRIHEGDVSGLLEILATESLAANRARPKEKGNSKPSGESNKQRNLSSKEKRELEALPAQISDLETEISRLDGELSGPNLYASNRSKAEELTERRRVVQGKLGELYSRWEKLETIAN